ncbi:unnamed protein product [Strongylus vulgaris]|uniref:Uncharacterized protein n=1 Tax=Strongylus vulgaris TaxID=40348 RepID=A0A3P7I904_STRVU|nr:unnamed protein product [Strongylus vulgaris]
MRFLKSRFLGGFSSFIRCVYQAKRVNNNTVTLVYKEEWDEILIADANAIKAAVNMGVVLKINIGASILLTHLQVPVNETFRMAGVYVLLAFVLLVFVVGTVLMIVCYQRSKNKQRKEQRQAMEYGGYAGSQVGVPGAYSSYGGPTY